jgi:hypothetical protein
MSRPRPEDDPVREWIAARDAVQERCELARAGVRTQPARICGEDGRYQAGSGDTEYDAAA